VVALHSRARRRAPSAGGAHGGHPRDQGVEVGGRLGCQARAILEQRPVDALQGTVHALLEVPARTE